MSETQQEAQKGVADPVRGLSDNTKTLVRREIAAAELEMLGKAKQAMPSVALLGAAGMFGVLSLAASYRLSVRLLEKRMPPAAAALVAATGYGVAAGASGAVGMQQLHSDGPLVPVETVRAAVASATGKVKAVAGSAAKTATDTAKKAASGVTGNASAGKLTAVTGTAARKATDKAKTAASIATKQAAGTTAKAAADKVKATAGTAAKKATDSARMATDTAKNAASSTGAKRATGAAATRATGTAKKAASSAGAAKTPASRSKSASGTTAKKPAGTTKKAADTTPRSARPRTSRHAANSE